MSIKNIIASSVLVFLFCTSTHAQVWSNVDLGVCQTDTNFATDVKSFFVYDNKLIVSGEFDKAGTTHVNNVASWNGSQWDSLGFGLGTESSGVFAKDFCEWNGDLYAGGWFPGANAGQPYQYIPNTEYLAKWDGTLWSAVSNVSLNSRVHTVIVYNNELYAAGIFTQVGSLPVHRIAKWNGTNWNNVGGGVIGFGIIDCMAVYNGELYVGGDFGYAGGIPAQFIARWNGSVWDSVGSSLSALNAPPRSFVVDTVNNVLLVGGPFTGAGGQPAFGAAKWDGSNWSALSNDTIIADDLEIYHNELYAASQNLYKLIGQSWVQISTIHGSIFTLKTYNDTLYVGGAFDTLNGNHMNYISRYYAPNTTLIKKQDNNVFFNIYPNPTKKEITIELAAISKDQVSAISIYDMQGKLEREIDMSTLLSTNKLAMNIETLKSGSYIVQLRNKDGKKSCSQKFTVN